VHDVVRTMSPRLVDDRSLSPEIELVTEAIRAGAIVAAAESEIGPLA
jgi:histidine ammonia-lyase